ncbi:MULTISPECIES: metalloregulator ArsR/SmtB family transcription factor [unclassified Frankia]|uniref:helix-turn-helix transcriptional regulator n=1 Tax=unclassified Frankia TaxID=2632575 RepID=UPI00193385F3|nr:MULTISPECIES: helix-turn-helix domain-containing protein [unclassified Frankia]MBL7620519.1 ArsR family transcriptional regulator [Frankia sp. AgB1.8]
MASRLDLLRLLRAAPEPLDAHQLAQESGLAVSTVRFHLDRLAAAGLVVSEPRPRSTPGRPRVTYTSTSPGDDRGAYEQLAGALAANLADSAADKAARAERAGRAWADERFSARSRDVATAVARPPGRELRALGDVMREVMALFTEVGFDPELAGEPGGQRLLLHACPFLGVAKAHPDVVCTLHLGLLRGALEHLGAPPLDTRLVPFAEPGLCVAHLTAPSGPARGRSRA